MLRQISMKGGVSYAELEAFMVFDFFVTLSSFDEEVQKEIAAQKKRQAQIKANNKKRK